MVYTLGLDVKDPDVPFAERRVIGLQPCAFRRIHRVGNHGATQPQVVLGHRMRDLIPLRPDTSTAESRSAYSPISISSRQ